MVASLRGSGQNWYYASEPYRHLQALEPQIQFVSWAVEQVTNLVCILGLNNIEYVKISDLQSVGV